MSGSTNDSSYQTTVSWAKAETSNNDLAREVEVNAMLENKAAHDAANAALKHSPGTTERSSQTSEAIDRLERDSSLKTQDAVNEGKRDVQGAQAAGASYLNSAIETAKNYLPASITGVTTDTTTKPQ